MFIYVSQHDTVPREFTPEKSTDGRASLKKAKEAVLDSGAFLSKKRPADASGSVTNHDGGDAANEDPLAEFYAQAICDQDASVHVKSLFICILLTAH